ncbi:hypothetical protein [Poseidonocella sp. HB161398]|uniref:hypothetical protein n=1 Tax=Poseidonocella sp. HB161398 TaxID=2320855 RepID=UPI00110938ED|nr:hypothetical protein [Poseidonocella sp. HB161398]
MHFPSYSRLLRALRPALRRGPVALVMAEDALLAAETAAWAAAAGIACRLALGPAEPPAGDWTGTAPFDAHHPAALAVAANALIRAAPGSWILPLRNGERPVWPHGDSRPLPDLFAFLEDERRPVLGGVVLDSYPAGDGWAADLEGYSEEDGAIHGGLRERIGPACPAAGRRIDRALAFRARPGLALDAAGRLNDPGLDRRHGAWHRSPAGALVSPRVWAWLEAQPDHDCRSLPRVWAGSLPLDGTARQLADHGFLEPGQWA